VNNFYYALLLLFFLFTALFARYCTYFVFSYSAIQPQVCLINSAQLSSIFNRVAAWKTTHFVSVWIQVVERSGSVTRGKVDHNTDAALWEGRKSRQTFCELIKALPSPTGSCVVSTYQRRRIQTVHHP